MTTAKKMLKTFFIGGTWQRGNMAKGITVIKYVAINLNKKIFIYSNHKSNYLNLILIDNKLGCLLPILASCW